jgi:hypothetical protein
MKNFRPSVSLVLPLLLVLALLGVLAVRRPAPLPSADRQPAIGFAVVELFTSEGCSSCPPADRLLAKVGGEYPQQVYVLAYHVDYWDRMGWKDSFSNADYTRRQQEYARLMRSNEIFTPQAIVNGKTQFVGSDERKMKATIDEALKTAGGNPIRLSAHSSDGKELILSYAVDNPGGALLHIALVQGRASSDVLRGENQGRHLEHVNIVRTFLSVSLSAGAATGNVSLKLPAGVSVKDCKVIAFLQSPSDGRIAGAGEAAITIKAGI